MASPGIIKHIKINLRFLNLLGQWTDKEEQQRKFSTDWFYSVTINFFLMGLFNLGQLIYVLTLPDFQSFARSSYVAFACSMASFKSLVFQRRRKLFKDLLTDLGDESFQGDNVEQQDLIESAMKPYKWLYLNMLSSVVILSLAWIVAPLFSHGNRLQFLSWYPFDWTGSSFSYVLCYLHQSFSGSIVCTVNVNLDGLAVALFSYISAECDLLCHRLRNVDREEDLVKSIGHYRKILTFTEEVANCYNSLVFAQFVASATSFCLAMFQLSFLSPTDFEFANLVIYQICVVTELFMYCWFGNNVIVKSENILGALYECPWVDWSPMLKKNLIFFMQRALKPIKILAIDFFRIDLPTFAWILRTAWSTFLVIRQVQE